LPKNIKKRGGRKENNVNYLVRGLVYISHPNWSPSLVEI
jgi:hypothetical protein